MLSLPPFHSSFSYLKTFNSAPVTESFRMQSLSHIVQVMVLQDCFVIILFLNIYKITHCTWKIPLCVACYFFLKLQMLQSSQDYQCYLYPDALFRSGKMHVNARRKCTQNALGLECSPHCDQILVTAGQV